MGCHCLLTVPKLVLWKEHIGVSVRFYSATRWWSQWEVLNQLITHFGDVELFLSFHNDIAPATMTTLVSVLYIKKDKLRNGGAGSCY